MRQIVLDTETTGISPEQGHRIIEVGCIELYNRKLTGNHFHYYINPQREIDEGAQRVHGISLEFLQDKPLFSEIADELLDYLEGAELIIHNAPFDLKFLDSEYRLLNPKQKVFSSAYSVIDTLVMARKKYPGQRNSLDALCKRLSVDNSNRELHGALLDSEILAQVYLAMTSGQTDLQFEQEKKAQVNKIQTREFNYKRITSDVDVSKLKVITASQFEMDEHKKYLVEISKSSDGAIWDKQTSVEE